MRLHSDGACSATGVRTGEIEQVIAPGIHLMTAACPVVNFNKRCVPRFRAKRDSLSATPATIPGKYLKKDTFA